MRSRKRFNITTITCVTPNDLNCRKIPRLGLDREVVNVAEMRGLEADLEIRELYFFKNWYFVR